MQLTIKGLKGDQDIVEVQDDASILDLKAVIMSQLGHDVPCQKLLFKGKILDDSKSLQEYGITASSTIVLMVTKSAEPSPFEKNVQVLASMGVDRAEAEALLKMFENDLEKAKAFLIQSLQQAEDENEEYDDEEEGAEVRRASQTFGFLLNSEEFLRIREILRSNPNEFEPMMVQMAVSNPELYTLIKNNTEEFLELVGLRMAPRERIEVTDQEEADIRELCQLGFAEEDAVEAYIACDKNKELAASYLFENYQQKLD